MDDLVRYEAADGVATITMDDGKVNVVSTRMVAALGVALDRAEAEGAVVLLTGREAVFSAGFDLKVLTAGGAEAAEMLRSAFALSARLLAFPTPVVVACTGHAIAMGTFLLLSGDYRVGAAGPFRFTANEVAIGLTVPWTAVEICRQRLAPGHLDRVLLLAEPYSPDDAVAAGFLDRVVAPEDVLPTARAVAVQAASLDLAAHAATKQRLRKGALEAVAAAQQADEAVLAALLG